MVAVMQALATPCSAFPKDPSALAASISACRSSIAALESSLKTTEGSSGGWETFAWVCSIAVALGVAAEIVGIVWQYWDDLKGWRRGTIRSPDRPSFIRFFWFEMLATVVVVAGVFGEAWASKELASINSQLRSKTSELRSDSDQLLALVTQQAGDAVQNAQKANDLAEAAGLKVNVVSAKADQIDAGLRETQWAFSMRNLQTTEERDAIIKQLKRFQGKTIFVRSLMTLPDIDGFRVCGMIIDMARAAGMNPINECGKIPPSTTPPSTGIQVCGPDDGEMLALSGALSHIDIGTTCAFGNLPHSPNLVVSVGSKALMGIGETFQTEDAERRAAAIKKKSKPNAKP